MFSAQAEVVVRALMREGHCFSRREYVERKYEESAQIFLAAYGWFVREAQRYAPRPAGAGYPYWAFAELYNVEASEDSRVLKLSVPRAEAVFFDMYDWIKVLRLQYLGETEAEEARFKQKLADYGVRREMDVILTNFYPALKREVEDSWQRLFRHHESIRQGLEHGAKSVQAGLWQLKQEWLISKP